MEDWHKKRAEQLEKEAESLREELYFFRNKVNFQYGMFKGLTDVVLIALLFYGILEVGIWIFRTYPQLALSDRLQLIGVIIAAIAFLFPTIILYRKAWKDPHKQFLEYKEEQLRVKRLKEG
jgi:hypothetical protein